MSDVTKCLVYKLLDDGREVTVQVELDVPETKMLADSRSQNSAEPDHFVVSYAYCELDLAVSEIKEGLRIVFWALGHI